MQTNDFQCTVFINSAKKNSLLVTWIILESLASSLRFFAMHVYLPASSLSTASISNRVTLSVAPLIFLSGICVPSLDHVHFGVGSAFTAHFKNKGDPSFTFRVPLKGAIVTFDRTGINGIQSESPRLVAWHQYALLVYTTPVNSAFRAIWLVPLSRDIKYYSPPGGFRRKKWHATPILS